MMDDKCFIRTTDFIVASVSPVSLSQLLESVCCAAMLHGGFLLYSYSLQTSRALQSLIGIVKSTTLLGPFRNPVVVPCTRKVRCCRLHTAAQTSRLQSQSTESISMEASGTEKGKATVAVVGAGVAGLVCASWLGERGLAVTVFDMGRGPGGRMSQRRERTQDGMELMFDHGAQYFTVKDPAVQQLVDKWEVQGILAEWQGRFGMLEKGSGGFVADNDRGKKRYVGVPGMNALCKALSLSHGVQARYGVTVTGLEWRECALSNWHINSTDGESLGTFSAVVVADKGLASSRFTAQTGLPPPLAGVGVPELTKKVGSVTTAPCFALMLGFPMPLTSVPFDGATIVGSKIVSWAARDSSKPGRNTNPSECWVVHSTAEYAGDIISKAGFGKPSTELLSSVALDLLTEFQAVIPDVPSPTYMRAHRWGGAFPTTFIAPEDKCILVEERRLAVCGDFCVGPRVEGAILSGLAAAERIAKLL